MTNSKLLLVTETA